MHTSQGPAWLNWAIPLVIIVIVMSVRLRRVNRMMPLKLERLWVVPAIYAGFAAVTMWTMPPRAVDVPWLLITFAAGGAIGWYRGRMMRIHVDPATHALNQQSSPAAMLFLLALVVIRMGMRSALSVEAADDHLTPAFVTDVFIVFALGLFALTRLEMFIRARRLLDAARSATAGT